MRWIQGDDEWEDILLATCTEPVRNRLMLLLAYDGALRRSELVALTLRDLEFPHQQITVRPEVAKNGRGRVVMFGDVARELLQRYLGERAAVGIDGGPLFRSQSDWNRAKGLRPDAWDRVVARIGDRAGLTHRGRAQAARSL